MEQAQKKKNREVGIRVVAGFVILLWIGIGYMVWLGQHQEADSVANPLPQVSDVLH